MEETLQQLQVKDTKERMAGVERLQVLLEQSRKVLSASDVTNIVEATKGLLNDSNFRVCQGALQALESVAALAGDHLKMHFTTLIPSIVECLGDSKQPVRDAGRRLLLALMEISSPSIVVERAGSYAWMHKNWRVREEFARTAASSVSLFAATEIPLQRLLLPSILQLLEDSNSNVRDAAVLCLQEMYRRGESQLRDELERHSPQPEYVRYFGEVLLFMYSPTLMLILRPAAVFGATSRSQFLEHIYLICPLAWLACMLWWMIQVPGLYVFEETL